MVRGKKPGGGRAPFCRRVQPAIRMNHPDSPSPPTAATGRDGGGRAPRRLPPIVRMNNPGRQSAVRAAAAPLRRRAHPSWTAINHPGRPSVTPAAAGPPRRRAHPSWTAINHPDRPSATPADARPQGPSGPQGPSSSHGGSSGAGSSGLQRERRPTSGGTRGRRGGQPPACFQTRRPSARPARHNTSGGEVGRESNSDDTSDSDD